MDTAKIDERKYKATQGVNETQAVLQPRSDALSDAVAKVHPDTSEPDIAEAPLQNADPLRRTPIMTDVATRATQPLLLRISYAQRAPLCATCASVLGRKVSQNICCAPGVGGPGCDPTPCQTSIVPYPQTLTSKLFPVHRRNGRKRNRSTATSLHYLPYSGERFSSVVISLFRLVTSTFRELTFSVRSTPEKTCTAVRRRTDLHLLPTCAPALLRNCTRAPSQPARHAAAGGGRQQGVQRTTLPIGPPPLDELSNALRARLVYPLWRQVDSDARATPRRCASTWRPYALSTT